MKTRHRKLPNQKILKISDEAASKLRASNAARRRSNSSGLQTTIDKKRRRCRLTTKPSNPISCRQDFWPLHDHPTGLPVVYKLDNAESDQSHAELSEGKTEKSKGPSS